MKDEELEIDLRRIWQGLRRNLWYILALAAEGMLAALMVAMLLPAQYRSTVVFYVNNNAAVSGERSSEGISSGDIAASKELVESYLVLLQARETLEGILAYADVEESPGKLWSQIQAAPVKQTEFFEVAVTAEDPQKAERLASAISVVLPLRISEILTKSSAEIVDSAIAAPKSQGLTPGAFAAIGFGLGLVFALSCAVLEALLDTTIRSREDVEKRCPHPVLADVSRKGGYGLLRAKLEFLTKETQPFCLLGVTSSVRGEGKNQVSENLARSLTKRGKQVLLVDCDIRASRTGTVENRCRALGLADYLSGDTELERIIQHHTLDRAQFDLIPAGKLRGNFAELLASEDMEELLDFFQARYDYVILSLPVLAEAGDCLNLLSCVHGVLLTVRRDVCKFALLQESLRQMEFVNARVLGVAYQDLPEQGAKKTWPVITLAGWGAWKQKVGEMVIFGG